MTLALLCTQRPYTCSQAETAGPSQLARIGGHSAQTSNGRSSDWALVELAITNAIALTRKAKPSASPRSVVAVRVTLAALQAPDERTLRFGQYGFGGRLAPEDAAVFQAPALATSPSLPSRHPLSQRLSSAAQSEKGRANHPACRGQARGDVSARRPTTPSFAHSCASPDHQPSTLPPNLAISVLRNYLYREVAAAICRGVDSP